jgi:hypothetical protein
MTQRYISSKVSQVLDTTLLAFGNWNAICGATIRSLLSPPPRIHMPMPHRLFIDYYVTYGLEEFGTVPCPTRYPRKYIPRRYCTSGFKEELGLPRTT